MGVDAHEATRVAYELAVDRALTCARGSMVAAIQTTRKRRMDQAPPPPAFVCRSGGSCGNKRRAIVLVPETDSEDSEDSEDEEERAQEKEVDLNRDE
jgi:hypothetical protein